MREHNAIAYQSANADINNALVFFTADIYIRQTFTQRSVQINTFTSTNVPVFYSPWAATYRSLSSPQTQIQTQKFQVKISWPHAAKRFAHTPSKLAKLLCVNYV